MIRAALCGPTPAPPARSPRAPVVWTRLGRGGRACGLLLLVLLSRPDRRDRLLVPRVQRGDARRRSRGHFGWSGTRRTFVVRFQSAQWRQKRMTVVRMRSRIVSITSASAFSGTSSVPDDRPAIWRRAFAGDREIDRSCTSSNSSAPSPTARSAWNTSRSARVDGRSLQRREQAVTAEPAR